MSEGTLQAFLDGELPAEDRTAVVRHLAGCGPCDQVLSELRAAAFELTSALGLVDAPAPTEAAREQLHAAPHVKPSFPLSLPRRRSVFARNALARAALLVLGISAAASATVPGSPVRDWIVATWNELTGRSAPVAEAPPASEPLADQNRIAGVSVMPVDGRIRISLTAPAAECRIRVRLVEGELAAVYALGSAAGAHFAIGSGHATVDRAGPGEIRIDLPSDAHSAIVEVDGRIFVSTREGRLRAHTPATDTSASELLFTVEP